MVLYIQHKERHRKEKAMTEMKQYLVENNLTRFVRELVDGGFTSEGAIEYVYDQHTLSNEEFTAKYWKAAN